MFIEQIYTKCLSQASYFIESEGEAVVIDPLRDVEVYINLAKKSNAKIKYVIETHFHADFVSGHLTLSNMTGAEIIYGPNADPEFDSIIAKDNQIFNFGKVSLKTIHTPGHTLESTSFLLKDEQALHHSIFTGDTLFLGDVGIPDVAQRYKGVSKEELAGILFDSINQKIKPLPDHILVYPAHGAGSACGINMMKETVDTLGNQKKINYSLNNTHSKKEFIQRLTKNLPTPPSYFPQNVILNQKGYKDLNQVISNSKNAFSVDDFETEVIKKDVKILDVRTIDEFLLGHIQNSIFIGLDGSFAPWVGAILSNVNQPILLVVDESRFEEAVIRLSRVGFDNVIGYLKGGFKSWKEKKSINYIQSIHPEQMFSSEFSDSIFLDVRKTNELETVGKVNKAINISLQDLSDKSSTLNPEKKYLIYCAGGYRSVIASSILNSKSFSSVYNVYGGFSGIKKFL